MWSFRLMLYLAFLPGLVVAQAPTAIEKTVDELHRKKFQWLIEKQYDSLAKMLDPRLQFIHSNGWIQTSTEVIDDLKSGKLNYTGVTVDSAQVRQLNPLTIRVVGRGLFAGIMNDGQAFEIRLLYTELYVRTGRSWKLVHRQSTRLP